VKPLCLLALATMAFAPAALAAEDDALAGEVRAAHEAHAEHAGRVEAISRLFVGVEYGFSPLGEGIEGSRDADPIFRADRFDCLTYVEEVMALSWFADLDVAKVRLQDIRYAGGRIDYGARNHIMEAQWIPANIAAGFVRDVTRELGGKGVSDATLTLGDDDYESEEGRALLLEESERVLGTFSLPVVAPKRLASLALPAGTLINVVRSEREGIPTRVSHVGLVVVRHGKLVVRHAHKPRGKVVEDSVPAFIAAARRTKKWPLTGFNLLEIASQAP
jgi:hypothetical protein